MKAIYRMINLRKSQSIIVSGEGGSGKTETAKHILKFISNFFIKERVEVNNELNYNIFNRRVSRIYSIRKRQSQIKEHPQSLGNEQSISNDVSDFEEQIMSSTPLLEAFGNCKTFYNDNSSRFGCFINIFCDLNFNIIRGCHIKQFLLEKSRVISPIKKERNFHIFYQLLKGLKLFFFGRDNKGKNNEEVNQSFAFGDIDIENYLNVNSQMYTNLINEYNIYFNIMPKKELLAIFSKLFSEHEINILRKIPDFFNVENFNILKTDCYEIPDKDEAKLFLETLDCFIKTGFKSEEIISIIKLILFILLQGNVEFEKVEDFAQGQYSASNICRVKENSLPYIDTACELMQFDLKTFCDEIFFYNILKVQNETIKTNNSLSDCYNSRNSFIKEIYHKIFLYLVSKLNNIFIKDDLREMICAKNENIKTLGILDIYGYECFETNNFEQFSINYANEKLHQLYISNIFKQMEKNFAEENLTEYFEKINYTDNLQILELMEKDKDGIIKLLENECLLTKSDDNFLNVLKSTHKTNDYLKNSALSKENFAIHHSSKVVEYTSKEFISKNIDFVKPIMQEYFFKFPNELYSNIFKTNQENIDKILFSSQNNATNNKNTKQEKLLLNKFKNDLNSLVEELSRTECNYVHCIKPNENKQKQIFNSQFVLNQIRYLGIFDTINFLQSGFCIKYSFKEFYSKYEDVTDFENKINVLEINEKTHNVKDMSIQILQELIPGYKQREKEFLIGLQSIIMKRSFLNDLDKVRKHLIYEKERNVTRIAARFRSKRLRKLFFLLRNLTIKIQRNFRRRKNKLYLPQQNDVKYYHNNIYVKKFRILKNNINRLLTIQESKNEIPGIVADFAKKITDVYFLDKIRIINLKELIKSFAKLRMLFKSHKLRKEELKSAELARKQEEENKKMEMIIFIQKLIRGFLTRKKVLISLKEMRELKVKEQEELKAKIDTEKLLKAQKKLQEQKAIIIQTAVRRYLIADKIKHEIKLKKEKELLLEAERQNHVRKAAEKEKEKFKLEKIILMQKNIKYFLNKKHTQMLIMNQKQEEIKLKLKQEHDQKLILNAIIIQKHIRGFLLRLKIKKIIEYSKTCRKQASIELIQKSVRLFLYRIKIKKKIENKKRLSILRQDREKEEREKLHLKRQKKMIELINISEACCLQKYFNKMKLFVKEFKQKELINKKQRQAVVKMQNIEKKQNKKILYWYFKKFKITAHRIKLNENKKKKKPTSSSYDMNNLEIVTNYNFQVDLKNDNNEKYKEAMSNKNLIKSNNPNLVDNKAKINNLKRNRVGSMDYKTEKKLEQASMKDYKGSSVSKNKKVFMNTQASYYNSKIQNNIKNKANFGTNPNINNKLYNTNKNYYDQHENHKIAKKLFDSGEKNKIKYPDNLNINNVNENTNDEILMNSNNNINKYTTNTLNNNHKNNLKNNSNNYKDYSTAINSNNLINSMNLDFNTNYKIKNKYAQFIINNNFINSETNMEDENIFTAKPNTNIFLNEVDEMKFFEENYMNMISLFPNYHYKINKNDFKTMYNINNLLNLQLYYEKKLLNYNTNLYHQTSYLNSSPYEEPKLNFFAYVLDLDSIIPANELYMETWGKTLQEFLKAAVLKNNPIQLIEISAMNTMLVNSLGKVYSWGWCLKNQNSKKNQNGKEADFHDENEADNSAIMTIQVPNDYNKNFINETNLNLNINHSNDLSIEYTNNLKTPNLSTKKKNKNINNSRKTSVNDTTNNGNSVKSKKNYIHSEISNLNKNTPGSQKTSNNIYKKNSKNKPSIISQDTIDSNSKNISSNNSPNNSPILETSNFNKGLKSDIRSINEDSAKASEFDLFKPEKSQQQNIFADQNNNSSNIFNKNESDSHNIGSLNVFNCNGNSNVNNCLTFYNQSSAKNIYNNNIDSKNKESNQNKISSDENPRGSITNVDYNKIELKNFINNKYSFGFDYSDQELNKKIKKVSIAGTETIQESFIKEKLNYNDQDSENQNNEEKNLTADEPEAKKLKKEAQEKLLQKKTNLLEKIFNLKNYDLDFEIFDDFVYTPFPKFIDNITARTISCSRDFNLFVSKNNSNLYVLGNNERNNLAFGNKLYINEPLDYFRNIKNNLYIELTECEKSPDGNVAVIMQYINDISKAFFNKFKIVSIKNYGKGFILLNDKGQVYFVTENLCENFFESLPSVVSFNNIKISQVECGNNFCMYLSTTGLLFSQGDNAHGQLGLGDFVQRKHICEIPNIKDLGIKTVQVSCGYKHVIIRSSTNKVYTWGNNTFGQLGNGTFEDSPFPCLVEISYNQLKLNFLQVSAGLRSSCFMSDDRKIFWCGTNGDIIKQEVPIEFNYKEKIPELFSYDNHQIIKIHHSYYNRKSIFYAVITDVMMLRNKLKNPQKLRKIINTLTSEWVTKDIYVPNNIGAPYAGYISQKFISK